jgi:hypothetical protein
MRTAVCVQVVLLCPGVLCAQAEPKDAKSLAVAYMLGEPDRLVAEFSKAREHLSRTKAKVVRVHFNGSLPNGEPPFFPSEAMKASFVKSCAKQVSDLAKSLEAARSGDLPLPKLLDPDDDTTLDGFRLGRMGTVTLRSRPFNYSLEATIRQIIDEGSMLVRLEQQLTSFRDGELHRNDKIVVVRAPTAGRADDEKFSFEKPIVVTGTYRYNTAVGARTVFVLEEVDSKWLLAEVKRRIPPATVDHISKILAEAEAEKKAEAEKEASDERAAAEQKAATEAAAIERRAEQARKAAKRKEVEQRSEAGRRAAIEEAKYRTWTDSTGDFETKAVFGGVAGGLVKLIKRDGSIVRVPLARLSTNDQNWIESRKRGN